MTRLLVFPFILLVLLAACSSPPASPDVPRATSGTAAGARLTGRVVVEGTVPPTESVRLDADPQCAALVAGETREAGDLEVGEAGGLRNVFVYIKEGVPPGAHPAPQTPVVLDQERCRYVPRVLGLQVGQTLVLRNSDPLLHTIRAEATANPRFNIGTPVQGMEVSRTFRTPEVMVPVGCDMHPWMQAYIGVLDHPYYAVTDATGAFTIAGVPPGRYVVEAWHERLGTRVQDIVLDSTGTRELSWVFTVP